jgi:hypothetical protein
MSVPVRVMLMNGLSESISWVTPIRRIVGCWASAAAPASAAAGVAVTLTGAVTRADTRKVIPSATRLDLTMITSS